MQNEVKRKHLEQCIPMGGVSRPEGMAGRAVFLASEHLSGYMRFSGPSGWRHVCLQ